MSLMNPASRPLFSVIMPAYNSAEFIVEAIESVLAQRFERWELLIVDDGSTDSTLALASSYAAREQRIRVLSQTNAGTASARNLALEHATGSWALLLDSDDMLLPHCMSTYERFIADNPGHVMYSCNARILYPSGRQRTLLRGKSSRAPLSASVRDALFADPLTTQAAVADLETVKRVGGFAAGIYNEDYELWLHLLLAGYSHLYCPEILSTFRVAPGSKTKQHARTTSSSLEILESLDVAAVSTLGLDAEWHSAIRARRSAVVIGEMQELVLDGNRHAALRHLWCNRKSIVWARTNAARCAAVLLGFRPYQRWLRRTR